MRLVNQILLATLNREKYEEFKSLFSAHPDIELLSIGEIVRNPDKLQFVEQHNTYLENAIAKARLGNHASHYPILADDSGLEVDSLGGQPGVRSHRYATPKVGLSQNQANIELLLKELGNKPRDARFVCTLVLLIEGIMLHATETLEGVITDPARGSYGFGYDPIFIPRGSEKTLAEMTPREKNLISHRAKALHELMRMVKSHGIVLVKP